MARGMANNEPIVSQANTKEAREGYVRVFGDRKPQRGKWVMDPSTGKLVDVAHYQPETRALDAPIMSGRFYEEAAPATDGTEINSREKHRRYMREHGLALDSDYKETTKKNQEAKERFYQTGNRDESDRKQRREDIGRTIYELQKGARRG